MCADRIVTTPPSDPMVGRTIAHYDILARIGGGGMGVVYRARDSRLGRTVALKFLPPQWSNDESARLRFVREAQAASATLHPNICTIHDIETADDGQLFIVMAFYEGPTLKQRLDSGPLAVDEALDIASQIADGLARAHAQGVVHRDVKPGNVILTEDGVRVLDFGLATFADALKLTIEHSTLGTAAYMSPEQVRGESADARSDVWAVGVILYEMLAGHPPFQGSHTEAIAYAVRHETPAAIRAARPEVGEDVEQLVFRAMHKDPRIRYQNGRELSRALRQLRGLTLPVTEVVTPPADPRPVVSDASPKRRVRIAAAAIVIAVAAGGIWLAQPVERIPITVAPFGNQSGDSDLDQYRLALTQALTASLRDAPDLHVTPYSRVLEVLRRFVGEGSDVSNRDAIQAITASTGATLVVMPTLLREGATWRARVELRDPQTANNLWEHETSSETSSLTRDVAYRLAMVLSADIETHLKSRRTGVIETLMRLWPFGGHEPPGRLRSLDAAKAFADGTAWYDDLEYAQARRSFHAAVDLDPRNPVLLAWLSRAAQLLKDDGEATDAADRAVSSLTTRTPRVDELFVRAVAAEAHRDITSAERLLRELIAERPDEATWAMELGGFLDRQTRRTDAVAAYHKALMLDKGNLRARLELCRLYNPSRLNEPAEARTQGEAALAGYRAIGARGGEAQSLLCLVDTLVVGKDDERKQARSYAEAAHKIFDEQRYDFNLPQAEYYLAYVAGVQGQLAESVALGEKALTRAKESGNLVAAGSTMINLGVAEVARGNWMKGADYYEEAYKLYQLWHDESRAAQLQANRGAVLIDYGNPDDGFRDVTNALLTSERLGDRNFQAYCRRLRSTYFRNQGRHKEALEELDKGLAIARERNLAIDVTVMTTFRAQSQFETGDYDSARASFLESSRAVGRRGIEARIRLARTLLRIGDVARAETELETARHDLEASPNDALQALLLLVSGEWATDSGRRPAARESFERASASWRDALPEPAAVEARAYLGRLTAQDGQIDSGRRMILTSIDAARRLGLASVEARCRLLLAEIEAGEKQWPGVASQLSAIPPDDGTRTIGPELRAEAEYWQSVLHDARGETAAAAESLSAARALIRAVQDRLPEADRATFALRQIVKRLG